MPAIRCQVGVQGIDSAIRAASTRIRCSASALTVSKRGHAREHDQVRADEPPSLVVLCEVITHIERWKLTGTYRSARALIRRKRSAMQAGTTHAPPKNHVRPPHRWSRLRGQRSRRAARQRIEQARADLRQPAPCRPIDRARDRQRPRRSSRARSTRSVREVHDGSSTAICSDDTYGQDCRSALG